MNLLWRDAIPPLYGVHRAPLSDRVGAGFGLLIPDREEFSYSRDQILNALR
jgi:hypothetical protein